MIRNVLKIFMPCSAAALSGPVLRDTAIPPYCALWGFWCLNMANWVPYPVPIFLSVSPWSMRSRGAIPLPPQRGISAILARCPMKTRQMGAIPPLRYNLEKALRVVGGGISHWAAKQLPKFLLAGTFSQLRPRDFKHKFIFNSENLQAWPR